MRFSNISLTCPAGFAPWQVKMKWCERTFNVRLFLIALWCRDFRRTTRLLGCPLVKMVRALFWEFIERKTVIRGGVAKGPLYHRDGIVFGSAMNEAVELEKDVALFSRVVTTPGIGNAWRRYWGQPRGLTALTNEIREDQDGVFYIDVFHFPADDSLDRGTYNAFHRSGPALTSMLGDRSMGLKERSKLIWLARQFNQSTLVATRRICSPIIIPSA